MNDEFIFNKRLADVYDCEGYTTAEVLSYFYKKINNYVKKFDELELTTDEQLTYLLNEGLTKEVSNNIITLYNTGKLSTLITSDIFNNFKSQLDKKIEKDFIFNMSNMGQDIKEKLTGGNVAVVGENCVDTVNFTPNIKKSLCEESFGTIQDSTEKKKGFYHYNDGTYEDLTGSSLNYYNKLFSVNGNTDYKVTGRASGENASLCVFFDKDKNYIGYFKSYAEEGKIINAKDMIVKTPLNCKYMSVMSNDLNNYPIKLKGNTYKIINLNNFINEFNKFIDKNLTYLIEEEIACSNQTNGIYNKNTGAYEDFSSNSAMEKYSSQKLEVNDYVKFKISCKAPVPNSAMVIFYDKTDNYISYLDNATQICNNVIFEIPKNCGYIAIGTSDKYNYPLTLSGYKKTIANFEELRNSADKVDKMKEKVNADEFFVDDLQNKYLNLKNKDYFLWKKIDKKFITFCVDDGRHDVSKVADIFKEYNIPLCLAIPSDTLDNITDSGEKVKEVCLRVQNNGGEILSHSINSDTFKENTTDEEALYRIKMSKYYLSKAGLKIRGMIKPGGSDSVENLGTKWKNYIECYYDYGDEISTSQPYLKGRKSIATRNLDEIKELININNWIVFYFHTLDGSEYLNESKLRTILEYIKNSDCEVITYNNMINKYGDTYYNYYIKKIREIMNL